MSDVEDALVLLQEAVEKEIASTNDEGAELLRRGQLSQAKKLVAKSEGLEKFKKQVDALGKTYGKIGVSEEGRRGVRKSAELGKRCSTSRSWRF